MGFHDSVGSSKSSAPLKVPKASGVAGLERRGFGEGVREESGLSSEGGISPEVGNWGSEAETVLSEMVSNVECAGCHVEDGSFLQSDASVRFGSSQVVGSTDHDRVEMSSSRSP